MEEDTELTCLYQKLFPDLENGKIKTIEFLEASKGVLCWTEKFGRVFSPLYNDISGNIEKLRKGYEQNPAECLYIEDLIFYKSQRHDTYVDALLWLKRALHFLLIFFQNVVNCEKRAESLQDHMTSAYSSTLEPYHGWITKKLFVVFRRMVPGRTALLSAIAENKDFNEEALLKALQTYLEKLAVNVHHLTLFYEKNNLDTENKAP